MFFLVAATLNAAGDAIRQLRRHDREHLRGQARAGEEGRVADAERYYAQLSQRLSDLKNGRLDGWRWNEIPLPLP
jgi:hypothetical protein